MEVRIREPDLAGQMENILGQIFDHPPLAELKSNRQRRSWYRDIEIHLDAVMPSAKEDFKPLWNLDVGPSGFVFPQRWNRLLKEYLPPNWGEVPLDRKDLNKTKTRTFFFKASGFLSGHQNGGCLSLVYYWGDKGMLNCHFISRASYILPMGPLDWSLMHAMARALARAMRYPAYKIKWSIEQVFTSIWPASPWLLAHPELTENRPETWIGQQWAWVQSRRNDEDVMNSPYRLFFKYGQKKWKEHPEFIPPILIYGKWLP